MGNNRNLKFQAYFEVFLLIVGGRELITMKDPSLSAHGYQLLPIATSQLVGNNRNFIFQAYFEVPYSLLVEEIL